MLQAITFFWNVSDYLQSRTDLSSLVEVVTQIDDKEQVRRAVSTRSREGKTTALWLQVLLNLSSITTDERIEVRHSAIQTIQRIFENCSDQLSSEVWLLCLRTILFGMVQANLNIQRDIREQPSRKESLKEWDGTTKAVLQTLTVLNTTYMEKLDTTQLGDAWSELLGLLECYFDYRSHALGASVFATMTGVLSHTEHSPAWSTDSLLKTATVWRSYFSSSDAWQEAHEEDNQDAFVAYAEAFRAIYRLSGQLLATDLPLMLANLEACVVNSDEVAYSSDLDSMTTLQSRIMECLAMVKTEGDTEIPPYMIRLLGRFITLPYTSLAKFPEKRGPTFVALSKASMALLQDITVKHVELEEIYSSNALSTALISLAQPIEEKYVWQREGKAPTLWQKATTTSTAILESALPHVKSNKEIWTTLVDIAHCITRAQSLPNAPVSLEKDEQFDIESFAHFRNLITLPIGSSSVPDSLRRTYARNLFSTSLLHSPLPGELPDITTSPLEELYKIRLGQTAELNYTWRPDMSYTCLSELFDLVAVNDSSLERIKLAQAAAPYLILRCALPLKTYIADQPLRGRMPAPEPQRRELIFVLEQLEQLESEPQAIPDAPGVRSQHRRHLHRLYPLLLKASRVARQDAEVFEHLAKLTDLVGDEFGLDDD
jgi:hypothetical protein